jgi:hypothetical protein
MNDLPGWVGVVGALFALIAVLTGAVAIIWSTTNRTNLQVLKSTNEGLIQRVEFLESEAERKDKEHADFIKDAQAREFGLAQKVETLEGLVTGKELLVHLQASLDSHDARVDNFMLMMEQHDRNANDRHQDLVGILTSNKRLITEVARKLEVA